MEKIKLNEEQIEEYVDIITNFQHILNDILNSVENGEIDEMQLTFLNVTVRYLLHLVLKTLLRSLLFALDGFKARPTIDIDLLGERISNDRDSLKEVFLGFECRKGLFH